MDTGADSTHPELGPKISAAVDQDSDDDQPGGTDNVGHGTHVSSLACAATNDGRGLAGAGGDCQLVIERSDLSDSSIASSIVDATNRGAHAINLSLGDSGGRPPVDAFVSAINYAVAHGVVVVTAAADDTVTDQGQPASLVQPAGTGPDLSSNLGLSVTSADFADGPSGGGVGSEISMAAYGAFRYGAAVPSGPPGILSTFPSNGTQIDTGPPPCNCRTTVSGSNNYAYLLYYGLGTSPDQARAVSLWKQAAARGQPESHFHLGDAALTGAGTRADTAEAVARYRAAIALAQQSHDSVDGLIVNDAKKALAKVPPLRNRDRLRADSLARLYGRTSTRTRP